MSLPDVLKRGDDFLNQYPRYSKTWQFFAHGVDLFTVGMSKIILNTFYEVKLTGFNKLEAAIKKSKDEDRGLLTMMNHMSVVDDPFIWGVFPWKIYRHLDNIRWCLGAENVCFNGKALSTFFSLGQVLATGRFGVGPFQGSIDACIRLLSPYNTLPAANKNEKHDPKRYVHMKPAWVHVYPEGFVLQLQPPFNNSMRYFKWGFTRMILEATKPPVVVPIFTTGFEKIASEETAEDMIERFLPSNFGTEINVTVGDQIDDKIITVYRKEWQDLVKKYSDPKTPNDLNDELKYGKDAEDLRSRLAAELRTHISDIRHNERQYPIEDPRFKSPFWWKNYTLTEGASDPDVQFIGKNWAIRRLQDFLNEPNDKDSSDKSDGKPN